VRRHEIDYVSLVAGALFLVVAGVHIGAAASDTELDGRWAVPGLLVLLGVVGLLGALRGTRPEAVEDAGAPVSAPGSVTARPHGDASDASDDTDGEAHGASDGDTQVLGRDQGTERP
jgi:hypothetical protein